MIAVVTPTEVGGPIVLAWSVVCTALIIKANVQRPQTGSPSPLPWLAWAAFLLTAGIAVRGIHGTMSGQEFPIPSPADLLHFPAYLIVLGLLVTLHRQRSTRKNFDAWLDGIALANALALVSWVTFYGGFVQNDEISVATRLTNAPFDVIVVLSVVVLLRISATPGARPHAYYLLGASIGALAVVDLAAAWSLATGNGLSLTVAMSPFVSGFALAAARHDTIHRLFNGEVEGEYTESFLRLLLVGAAIVAPVSIILVANDLSRVDVLVLGSLSALLSIVVALRIVRLIRRHAQTVKDERRLASSIATLPTKGSVEDVRTELRRSLDALLPEHDVALGAHFTGSWSFVLPEELRVDEADTLVLTGPPVNEKEMRFINTLLREGSGIVRLAESRSQAAQLESEAAAAALTAANERRFRALIQNSADVIIVLDPHTAKVSWISESVDRLFGYPTEEFVGRTLAWATYDLDWEFAFQRVRSFIYGGASGQSFEVRAVRSDGDVRLLDCVLSDLRNVEGIDGIVMTATDETAKRSLERDLADAETTDFLTLLLNRKAFIERTDAAIRRASVLGSSVSLAVINIDDFRLVNEGYGTAFADRVLVEIATRIRDGGRRQECLARLNGDEFGLLFPNGYTEHETDVLLERVLSLIESPINIDGRSLVVRATAGVAIDSSGESTALEMLSQADTALNSAKKTHRGALLHFESEMGIEVSSRVEIRNRLRTAIKNEELRLNFQPVVDIDTGQIVSLEALARWHDETLGDVSPGTFIPIAESGGMIVDLGDWALRCACTHLSGWAKRGLGDISLSVNMSAHQLRDDRILERVESILRETGVDRTRITIEITESVLLDDSNFMADRVKALRRLGVKLAIDDFGTGYSSLSYLSRYDFDFLKIDRSFVQPLRFDDNTREREIADAMIKLAQALGARTIAEGIEENEEYAVLRTLGCDFAQGYLFFRPVEAEEIPALLQKSSESKAA